MVVEALLSYSHVNSDSTLERVGDFLLTPSRIIFGGKNFVLLEKNEKKFRYEVPHLDSETPQWVQIALKIIAIPAILLAPLGLLLKVISLNFTQSSHPFTDWTTPIAYLKTKEDLGKLYDTCKQNDLIKELYFEIVSHPERYLSRVCRGSSPASYEFEPLGLNECACYNEAFDRFKSPRRGNLERRIIEDILKTKPDKEQPISLLSMGCGGMLQDWIIVGLLLKAGYKTIDIALVDTHLDTDKLEAFIQFFQTADAGAITVSHFATIDKVEAQTKYDAVLAIDFNEYLSSEENADGAYHYGAEDIAKAKGYLKKDGSLYLGYGQDDLVIKEQQTEAIGEPGVYAAISNDINVCQEKVRIAAYQDIATIPMVLPVVTKLADLGAKEISLDLVGKDNEYGYYPDFNAIEKVLHGHLPNDVSFKINQTDPMQKGKQKFDYIVMQKESMINSVSAYTPLLKCDGVLYLLSLETLNKHTKTDQSKLLTFNP